MPASPEEVVLKEHPVIPEKVPVIRAKQDDSISPYSHLVQSSDEATNLVVNLRDQSVVEGSGAPDRLGAHGIDVALVVALHVVGREAPQIPDISDWRMHIPRTVDPIPRLRRVVRCVRLYETAP